MGAGSIGKRHAHNARALGLRIVVCDKDLRRAQKLALETKAEGYYANCKMACNERKDITAAVIATPSGFHVENALFLAELGIHLFIEKPLATKMGGIDKLIETVKSKKIVTMMGQSYRFHEGYLAIKKMLDENAVGKILHVNFFGGQYLPDWHPKADYRTEYAAQKKLGGGVLFTSMSHTFDSVRFLFGEIKELMGWKAKLSSLEIDVDDSVFCLIKTDKNIVVECQSDFLQRVSKHRMIVVGERGTVEADFVRHTISIHRVGTKERKRKYAYDPNKRYVDELKYFVALVKKRTRKHDLDINAGKRVVELLLSEKIKAITKI